MLEPQNAYDNPEFFAGYAKVRENPRSANTVLEGPALRSLLPSLTGKRVLDLGCGTGGLCRYAIEQSAVSVVGVDVSEKMLEVARSDGDERIRYVCAALEDFVPEPESFDVVTSSLALHYIGDIRPVFERVVACLTPGGSFVFSVEHPMGTARIADQAWHKDDEGKRLYWPVDDYAAEGERTREWLMAGLRTYHRTVETYVNTVLDAGLRLERLLEAAPSLEETDFYDARRRPLFLFIRAGKP